MGEENSKNIGDFTFDNYNEKNYDKDKETAMELMCRHFEFYGQLNSPDIEYATRGAKLSCTYGNKYIYLDAVKDHGVYDGDHPVLTCKDCKVNENIYDFGACGNGKFEPLYSEDAPHPAETALNQKGEKRYVCRPILLGGWGYGDINSRSLLIGEVYMDKEYKVYKKESANDGKPSEYISHCINTIESQNETKNPIDAMQNREEILEEYVEALMTCDNLVCLYGGVITIVENSETEEETIEEEEPEVEEEETLEWIPETVMQLDGTTPGEIAMKKWIDATNDKCESEELKWNQDKINKVWEACRNFYYEYGVQVDPRLMISIIGAEGTGSFNTDMVNKAADGQNGPQKIFAADLENAVDVVGGKVMSYAYYKEDFSAAREKAYQQGLAGIKDYDDVLHYINWETPRVSTISQETDIGVYAGKNSWNRDVRQVYSDIAFDGAAGKYTEYALSLGSDKLVEVTQKIGAEIQTVQFQAAQEGMDKYGEANGEYVIKAK